MLFPYGHCPNSFRPPLPPSAHMDVKKMLQTILVSLYIWWWWRWDRSCVNTEDNRGEKIFESLFLCPNFKNWDRDENYSWNPILSKNPRLYWRWGWWRCEAGSLLVWCPGRLFIHSIFHSANPFATCSTRIRCICILMQVLTSLRLFERNHIFIGPESDHWECLSVTPSLTDWLTP